MSRLAGRTAIVTGGAVGIGRHYSQALADAGAQVVIADIVDGKEAADAIAAKHGRDAALVIVFDVSDENSVKMLVDRTMESFGKIDILVNNAAMFAQIKPTRCIDLDVETWDKVMAVNVRGPFLMAKHVAPHMMARRSGKIINVAPARPRAVCRKCCITCRRRARSWASPVRFAANWATTASASTRWHPAIR
jgi:NAD(P)-dependent dehydrogenase (short-subunit alcohol dehydrogenase family)